MDVPRDLLLPARKLNKRSGLLETMAQRLDHVKEKNHKLALEQQFIVVQPAWAPAGDGQQQQQQSAVQSLPHAEMGGQQQATLPSGKAAGSAPVAEATPAAAAVAVASDASSGVDGTGGLALMLGSSRGSAAESASGADGALQVEREVALMIPYVQQEVVQCGLGLPGTPPVVLPKQVTRESWAMVLEYCCFHLVSGRSDKERRTFDERFIRVDTNLLCELTSAADALEMRPLVDLASRAIARMIEGKSPDQIREAFRLPDDLTEEEKLEPLRAGADDPRIRMLNRLYAKKRKELQERKAQLLQAQQQAAQWQAAQAAGATDVLPAPQAQAQAQKDTRSLDELLSFIEDDGLGAKSFKVAGKPGKSKKKKAKLAGKAAQQPGADPSPPVSWSSSAPREPAAAVPSSGRGSPQLHAQRPLSAASSGMACLGEAACSPATTLPGASLGTSGHSSLESSPERLSQLPSPMPGQSALSGAAAAAAVGLARGRPPLWMPGLGGAAAGPLYSALLLGGDVQLDTDDDAEEVDEGSSRGMAVPVNPFAARTVLLHRPITTLTSLAAFRLTPPPASPSQLYDEPSLQQDPNPASSEPAGWAASWLPGTPDAGQGGSADGTRQANGADGTAAAATEAAAIAKGTAAVEGEVASERSGATAAAAASSPTGCLEAQQQTDAEAVAALLESFLEGMGLEQQLRLMPGPGLGQTVLSGVGPLPSSRVELQGVLPSGGLLQLSWRPGG